MSLLTDLRAYGAEVELRDGQVVLRQAPAHLIDQAREHKGEILAELRAELLAPVRALPWADQMIQMCLGLRPLLRAKIIETGDSPSRALHLVESFLTALRDHPRHGENWWARHHETLRAVLHTVLPEWWQDQVLEGHELEACVRSMFAVNPGPVQPAANPVDESPRQEAMF